MRKFIGFVLIAAGVFAGWLFENRQGVFNPAPDIAFVTVRGERFRLSDLRGRPVMVAFWASDCGPCIAEIPELDRLQREGAARGLQLIAVSMSYDLPSRVLTLIDSARVSYRVVLDTAGTIATAFDRVEGVPTTFLIAPDGTIRERFEGRIDVATAHRRIQLLLAEP